METGRRSRFNLVVVISAVLFLVFDSAVLGLGYWIAKQVEADAVTINLAGRQRMLSQRMVKTVLQLRLGDEAAVPADRVLAELQDAVALFDATLSAFAVGGSVPGGDGELLHQRALEDAAVQGLVEQTREAWRPYRDSLLALRSPVDAIPVAALNAAVVMAGQRNLALLDLSNRITSAAEELSRERTQRLRTLQIVAFLLALTNFFVLLKTIWLQVHGLRNRQEHAHRQAREDALTGLANRTCLLESLEADLAGLQRDAPGIVVCFLDLNGFKQVNDRHGHAAGDTILRQVADRLRRRLRRSDLIARIGGDEFVAILHNIVEPKEAGLLLDALVAAMAPGFRVDDDEIDVGLSIGAILIRSGDVAADEVLRLADRLMYEVKHNRDRDWRLMELVDGGGDTVDLGGRDGVVPTGVESG